MATSTLSKDPLDFLVDSSRHEDETDIKLRLHRMVYEAVTDPTRVMYEIESSLNYQYTENEFYTEEELQEFMRRGQPPTRRNELAPILERIAGQLIQTRQAVTFLGRNTPADDDVSSVIQDHQRWNDQQNLFEFQEQDMAWDGLVGGVGWLKSTIKRNDLGQETEHIRARNPFTIFKDPRSTNYDPNEDAKYICEGRWMDLEDAIELWPDQEDELRNLKPGPTGEAVLGESSVAPSLENQRFAVPMNMSSVYMNTATRARVRPFEVWYKRKVKVHYILRKDGIVAIPIPFEAREARQIVKELGDQVYAEPVWKERMYVGVILGDLLLHHDVSPNQTNLFPYIPFYTGLRKNGAPLALASRLVPIVESINKRESKALALLTNRQIVAEENTIEDIDLAQEEHAKPDGVVIVKEGSLQNGRVLFRDNLDMGTAQLSLLQEDKDAIRRVSGHGNESMGMPSEVRSGTGIARKQMMSNLIVTPMTNNLRRTRYMKARLSLELAKQYLTDEMAFQITDDPNAARTVKITKDHITAIKNRIYDLVITEMKDYAVLREQQAEMFLTVLPQLAALGPGFVKLGIQMTEFRDKEGLLKLVDQQNQPAPPAPKISLALDWKELTPEVQAFLSMTTLQSPELAQMIMNKGDDPAFLQRLKAELIQTQIKEGTRASIERGALDLSALQTAVEGRMQSRQFMQKQAQPAEPEAEGATV